MKRLRRLAPCMPLCAALAGCSAHYDHVLLVSESSAPVGAVVSSTSVQVPEGSTFVVDATLMSSTGPITNDFSFDLVSADADILGIEPALGRPAGTATFVVFGVSPGATQIQVLFNGAPETPIAATVTATPAE